MAWVIERSRSGRGCPFPAIPPAGKSPLIPVLGALATISLAIALAFALMGAWLVLPFAGLEVAALAWALRHSARLAAAVPPAPTFACPARMAASRGRPLPANLIRMINQRRKPF